MKTLQRLTLLAVISFVASSNIWAQDPKGFQFLFTLENDFLAPDNKDENYTGAFKIEVMTAAVNLKKLLLLRLPDSDAQNVSRFTFAGTGYTPQVLDSDEIQVGDRPYASLIYVSIGRLSATKYRMLNSELILGLMGTEGPGNVQWWIHENDIGGTVRPNPEGWHNQIGYKNHFVINYNVRGHQFLVGTKPNAKQNFQFAQAFGVGDVHLGTYMINLQLGLRLNLLNVNSTPLLNYGANFPTLFGVTSSTSPEIKAASSESKSRPFVRFNIFAEPMARLAAYNATLEGTFNDNSVYTIPHSEVKRLLFEFNAGVNIVLFNCFYAKYIYAIRSREFEGGKKFHQWGGITVGLSPRRWHH